MSDALLAPAAALCAGCAAPLSAEALSCPACLRLVHADELRRLAAEADAFAAAGDPAAAAACWRRALTLLPADAGQRASVTERIRALDAMAPPPSAGARGGDGNGRRAGVLGGVATAVLAVLGKAKLLLLGLTKLSTLGSMLVYFTYAWSRHGWPWALGLVLCIYVHEMGHVAALRRYGIAASAPLFIPGLGALVMLKERLPGPAADARVGLAGPLWGLGATVAAWIGYRATGLGVLEAVAFTSAIINLFNLTPVWQLDGGRAFHALTRRQRIIATVAVVGAWAVTRQSVFFIPLLGCGWQLFQPAAEHDDNGALALYVALLFAFGIMLVLAPGAIG